MKQMERTGQMKQMKQMEWTGQIKLMKQMERTGQIKLMKQMERTGQIKLMKQIKQTGQVKFMSWLKKRQALLERGGRAVAVLFIVAVTFSAVALNALPQEGIQKQFVQEEEKAKKPLRNSPQKRREVLERNLVRAVRIVVRRIYYDQLERYIPKININQIGYEQWGPSNAYYVKFEDLLIRFEFEFDPHHFLQLPSYIKYLQVGRTAEGFLRQEAKP